MANININSTKAPAIAAELAVLQYFTGKVATDEFYFNSLVEFGTLQNDYYAKMGVASPRLGAFEAMGKELALANPGKVAGVTANPTAFFADAYNEMFGHAGGPDQVQHFVDQYNYFVGIYTNAGMSDVTTQAAGAALGQMLGFAVQEDGTPYNEGVENFLSDASDESITYGKSLFDYESDSIIVEVPVIVEVPGPTVYVPVPGPTVYVPVPGPTEYVPVDQPDPIFKTFDTIELGSSKFVNATAGDDGSGGLHFGDGTTPGTGMIVAHEIDLDGVTVMASLRPRQTDGYVYQPKDTVVDDNTITANYIVAAGTQQIATGSFADNATRSGQALAFQFGSEGESFAELYDAGYTAHIAFDLDPTAGINYTGGEYIGVVQLDGTLDFDNTSGGPDITDNGGNIYVAGNSTLYGFRPGGLANANDGNQFTDHFYWMKDGVEVVGVVTNVTLDTGNLDWLHQY